MSDHDSDLEDIRPSKRRRASLFLAGSDDDDDDDDAQAPDKPRLPLPDVNAIFDDADNDPTLAYVPLAPPLDLDALRRQADARHAKNVEPIAPTLHQRVPNGSPPRDTNTGANRTESSTKNAGVSDNKAAEGTKERRKIFKLDEASLLGPNGFPQLIKDTKNFKPKGKGHEASDLNRLLQIYQFWAHRLNPKNQFRDTVERVEKLCHSKRMHVALSVWRDEARGFVNGRAIDISSDEKDQDDPESTNDAEGTGNNAQDKTSMPSSRESLPSTTRPPSSASEQVLPDDDIDIDELFREEANRTSSDAQPAPAAKVKATYGEPKDGSIELIDDDEAIWDEVMSNDPPQFSSSAPKVVPPDRLFDDDQDMWDVVREMEKDPQQLPSSISTVQPAAVPTDDDDDFESMFL